MVAALLSKSVELGGFLKGWVTLSANFSRGDVRVFPNTVIASSTGCQVIHIQIMDIMFRNRCRPKNHISAMIAELRRPTICILDNHQKSSLDMPFNLYIRS